MTQIETFTHWTRLGDGLVGAWLDEFIRLASLVTDKPRPDATRDTRSDNRKVRAPGEEHRHQI